ncbi:MAG: FAD-binding dehydrogenase [Deltaproteobacteria bacterium]|nr:FAD-binding dehydrogenase [Deltaproteobacteria bacterium]
MGTVRDYDVAVIGSGAAGLAAAVAAADSGAAVIVLEAAERVGGSSRLSGGHFFAAGTAVQRQAGIRDDADAMFEHIMTLNQWMLEPAVVRRYCDESAGTLDWVRGLGVEFKPEHVHASGVGSVPRGHVPQGEGLAVVEALDRERARLGVELALSVRATGLLRAEAGRVVGVRAGEDALRAGSVVVATGGFGANPEMIEQHFPDAAAAGDWAWYIGSPEARGDGLALGREVGAAIEGDNHGLLLLTPGFSRDLEIFLPGWLVLVDRAGRRFVDETASYTMMAGLVKRHGGVAFAIFDESARHAAEPNPLNRAYWVNEILAAKADAGRIVRVGSLAELAGSAGIDGEALAGTLERYNADCRRGLDTAFFKHPASGMRPIETPPFYAVEVRPAIIAWTGAGLRIDPEARVMGREERPIHGLYAAGETVGSLHGDRYIGGGGSFGPCLVFGRIAGENAAASALRS